MSQPQIVRLPTGLIVPSAEKQAKRLRLSSVLSAGGLTPAPNGSFDFLSNFPSLIPWDDFGNNTVGDCVEAATLHHIMAATAANGHVLKPDSTAGKFAYTEVTGWNGVGIGPGTDPTQMMSFWRHTGAATRLINQTQVNNPFTGSISGFKLTVQSTPPNPIKVGQPLSGNLIPVGTSIKTANSDGTFTVTGNTPMNIPSEAMSTKYTPPPIPVARDKIKAHAFIPDNQIHGDHSFVVDAMYNFVGGLATCAAQHVAGNVWDVPAGNPPRPTPDHWVYVGKADATGVDIITWGNRKHVTWACWDWAFYDVTVPLGINLIDPVTLTTPSGLDMAALDQWLLANGGTDQ